MSRSLESGILGGLWLMLLILLIYSWRVVELSSSKSASAIGAPHAVRRSVSQDITDLSRQKIITATLTSFKTDSLRIAELAEAWLSQAPDDYTMQKIALMARYQLAKQAYVPGGISNEWSRVAAHLKRAKELGRHDELFLVEAEFWLNTRLNSDPVEVRAYAKEIAVRYSVFGLGQYLIACSELMGRDRVAAQLAMKTAVEIEPEKLRYQKALKALQNGRDFSCEFPYSAREWLNLSD